MPETEVKTNRVKIEQLVQFNQVAEQWLNINPNNKSIPLAACIYKISPKINEFLKPIQEASAQFNRTLEDIKNKYAKTVKIIENSASPRTAICEYTYEGGDNIANRNVELDSEISAFKDKERAMLDQEVDIETEYVSVVPTVQILPPSFITVMRGIVIDPNYDKNKLHTIHTK